MKISEYIERGVLSRIVEETVSVNYMNKDKGFKADKKIFKGKNAYDKAVAWAKTNLEKFNMDNIKYESSNVVEAKSDEYALDYNDDRRRFAVYKVNGGKVVEYFKNEKDAIDHMDKLNSSKNESNDRIDEKLITFSNRSPYGQIVLLAGGAGSGKGFARDKFIDSTGFKVRDVDEMKKALGRLDKLGKVSIDAVYKKYGGNLTPKQDRHIQEFVLNKNMSISDLADNLSNPDNVASLHAIVDAMGLKDKWLVNMLNGKSNKETLPNLMFDMTAKKITSVTNLIKPLVDRGYDAKNIHLIWVLSNYELAVERNKKRPRVVPDDMQLQTHEGAAETIWGILTKAIPKGLNGRIDVILGNTEHTIRHKDSNGDEIEDSIKGFLALPIKPQGKSIFPEKNWKMRLYRWVLKNAPKSVDVRSDSDS